MLLKQWTLRNSGSTFLRFTQHTSLSLSLYTVSRNYGTATLTSFVGLVPNYSAESLEVFFCKLVHISCFTAKHITIPFFSDTLYARAVPIFALNSFPYHGAQCVAKKLFVHNLLLVTHQRFKLIL